MSPSVQSLSELPFIFRSWHHIYEISWCLKLILQVLFGDKMFSPHTFLDQFIATKVCNQKLFHHICSNFLFSFCGFDPKNLNMVCVSSWIWENNSFVAQRWGEFILNCMETTFQCLLLSSGMKLACSWLPAKAESLPALVGRFEKVLLLKILTNSCYWPKCHHWKVLHFN